jgi:ACS family tartrate transporter-like MFS transporter
MGWLKSMPAPRVLALGIVWFFALAPQSGLLFFLPQIVKDFGLTNVQAGFVPPTAHVTACNWAHDGGRHDQSHSRDQ